MAHYLWEVHQGDVPESESRSEIVKSGLKATNILQSPKADQFFAAVAKNKITGDFFWRKMQSDLGIPKDQIDILKSFDTEDKGELISSLLANYSYAIEINTSKQSNLDREIRIDEKYKIKPYGVYDKTTGMPLKSFSTKEEAESFMSTPSKYYSNLTVPGGTNYTENEIATPAITPSIKGHAQFATDQGIGWFRSDEEVENGKYYPGGVFEGEMIPSSTEGGTPTKTRRILEVQSDLFQKGRDKEDLITKEGRGDIPIKQLKELNEGTIPDFFSTYSNFNGLLEQKENIFKLPSGNIGLWQNERYDDKIKHLISGEEQNIHGVKFWRLKDNVAKQFIDEYKKKLEEEVEEQKLKKSEIDKNQFLQLLNKDNNWVTFFVKSIIQDSAKKGYEKVLFPSGNTASKVEGHTTLEEFKKQKENRIKELELSLKSDLEYRAFTKEDNFFIATKNNKSELINYLENSEYKNISYRITELTYLGQTIENTKNEINQLKQELERVEGPEGFGALKPIYNFYENTVKNILNKQYGKENVKQITDEYGNTWNEVEIVPEREQKSILLQTQDMVASKASAETVAVMKNVAKQMDVDIVSLEDYVKGNPDIDTKGINGLADLVKGVIAIAQGKENYTLTEEVIHVATAIIEQTNPKLITEMISKIGRFKIYDETLKAYKGKKAYQLSNGKPDIRKIKKEAVDKLIAELVINQSEGSTQFPELMDEANRSMIQKFFDAIFDFIKGQYRKSNIDIFQETSKRVLSGKVGGIVSDITNGGVFYQLKNSIVDKLYDTVVDFSKRLKVVDETTDASGKTIPRHYTLDGLPEQIPSVTASLKKTLPDRTDLQKFLDDQKKDWGTEIHDYIYKFVTNNLIDKDGYKLATPLTTAISTKLDAKVKKRVEDFMIELVNSYEPGTRFILEAKAVNERVKGKLASAIDFIAIEPYTKEDGTQDVKVDILDWKTTSVNKSVDEDIHWGKQKDWKAQMGEYTKILYNYGLKPTQLRKARMIPFVINYQYAVEGKPESGFSAPTSMEIGKLNSLEETHLYLLPVPINSETTGNPKIDSLVKSLREQWEKLYKKPVAAEDRYAKILEINKLSDAIRNLHVRLNFEPLVTVGKSFLTSARLALDDFAKVDYETISKEELDKKLGDLIEYGASAMKFTSMDQVFLSEYKREGISKENEKTLKELEHISSMAGRMLNEISDLQSQYAVHLGMKEGITTEKTKETILNAEREIDGFAKTFLEGSKLSAKIIKLASNLLMNAKSLVNIEFARKMKEYEKLLIPLEKEAAARGVKAFDLIGTMSPTGLNLIKKFDAAFWTEMKDAREKRDKAFFLKNMNITEYNKLAKAAIEKGLADLDKTVFSNDSEEDSLQRSWRKTKLKDSLDIESDQFDGYDNYRFKQLFREVMIEEGHLSKEYMDLRRNKAAFDVWEFYSNLNAKARQMGYLDKQGSSFFPLIEATMLQKFAQSDDLSAQAKESLWTDFYQTRINEEQNVSKIDPETGKVRKSIPKYFTRTDKSVNQLSTDLNKIGALWVKSLLEYESSKNLENTLLTLHAVEKAKGSLIVENGVVQFTDGELSVNESENKNADVLRTIIDDGLYKLGQDLGSLGNVGFATLGEKLGKTEEEKQAKTVNAKKLLSNADALTRSLAVGLKPLIAAANFIGYNFQAFVNEGTMYSFAEFQKNNFKVVTGTNFSVIQKGLLDLIVPLNEDVTTEERRKIAKKQGLGKYLSTWTFTDVMMSTNSFAEKRLQMGSALSIIDNSMVVDGKIVNIVQYLKQQDRNARKGLSESERKALEKSFKERVRELKESSSLDKVATIENDEVIIPGVSDLELAKFRTMIVEYGRKLNGQMNEDNKAGYRRDTIFSSFMMFKNWMPKLVAEHTLGIDKNAELDKWEYGRTRAFVKTWQHVGFRNISKMRAIITGTDEGLQILNEMLEAKKLDYFKKTGQELEITEEEFQDLIREQIANQMKELYLLFGVISLVIAAKAAEPPEDATEEEKNRYKWTLKLVNKISDEITFYYNPLSFESMTKGSVIPSLGLMSRATQVFWYTGKEMYGEATDNEEMIEKSHPTKYFFNMIPVAAQFQNELLPYLYPELAKEQGIRVTGEARSR
jgi:hypothetical protein